jgi:hypothetical protein
MKGYIEIIEAVQEQKNIQELRHINRAVIERIKLIQDTKALSIKHTLRIGQTVIVSGGRRLTKEEGKVTKINRTKAVVDIKGTLWNVPISMLAVKA